jgi:anti-anti-sigma factor
MGRVPADPVVVSFHGELTMKEAPALREQLLAAIRGGAGQLVVLDVTEVSFVDQAAVGVVMGARARLVSGGGDLRLAGPQATFTRVIRLLGLADDLPTYPTVAAAVADPIRP